MKFTQADFKIFKKECQRYIEILGLMDWEVFYEFDKCSSGRAMCVWNTQGRIATLILSNEDLEWEGEKPDPRMSAKHEALELLLAPLRCAALYGEREDVVREANHAIIRRLEKIL